MPALVATRLILMALLAVGEGPPGAGAPAATGTPWPATGTILHASRDPNASISAVWYADAMDKVFRSSQPAQPEPSRPPTPTPTTVQMAAARGERQPFQLVLSCTQPVGNVSVRPVRQRGIAAIDVRRVAYTHIEFPVNEANRTGLFPDPLPVEHKSMLAVGANPFWITVQVSNSSSTPSVARARLLVERGGDGPVIRIDLAIKIHDFAIPDIRHASQQSLTSFNQE